MTVSNAAVSCLDKDARIAELEAALAARDTLIQTLRVQLAQLRRMTFGQSSEKLSLQIEQLELTLEELEGEAAISDARTVEPTTKVERLSPVRSLPDHLPRAERRIEPEAGTCNCPQCGGDLRPLGEDSDEMLDVLPVQWRVIRTVRPKYSCRSCETIVQAAAPAKAIARGKASFATLAHIVVNKFDHHLPLYRQAEMMAAQGIDIDRSTLAGWAGQAAVLLDPIVSRIREEGLKASKIHTDDTPVPMLVPGKGKTAQARLWTYVVDDRASGSTGPAMVWYKFTTDRNGVHPQAELKSFSGLLQADGYAGYDKLYHDGCVKEVACWAHFRRKIFENHQTSPTPLTTDLLERIAALYRIEDEVRGRPPDVRRQHRQEHSKAKVDELRSVIDDALRRLSPKSAMARRLLMAASVGTRSPGSKTTDAPRSITISLNARCAPSPWAARTGSSLAPKQAASEPPPSTRSSRPANWVASNRKPISPTSSPKLPTTGQHHDGTNSCHGTGSQSTISVKPLKPRSAAHAYGRSLTSGIE